VLERDVFKEWGEQLPMPYDNRNDAWRSRLNTE